MTRISDLGLVYVNPTSRHHRATCWTAMLTAVIDQRLDCTARLRARWTCARGFMTAPFYRLVHAEGRRLPGVVIDRFGDAAVIQPNAAWADVHFEDDRRRLARRDGA
jgi:23S rRNA (cytosine1962-C5)-methyltransferase